MRHPLTTLLILPLILLIGCTGKPDGVQVVTGFDPARYEGKWFEIMRLDHSFERGLTNVTAEYTLRPDGTVRVVNSGFDPEECALQSVDGTAEFQGATDVASLSVTFFWPFAGGYHVFALDEENYSYAMVAGPTRDYLWILARYPDLAPEVRERLVAQAAAEGFAVNELILVDHSAQTCGK